MSFGMHGELAGNPWVEWLETDGLGGFAMGTVCGVPTRKYHCLLAASANPPVERTVLLNALEVHYHTDQGSFPLSTFRFTPDVLHPDGSRYLAAFEGGVLPTWRFMMPNGATITLEMCLVRDAPVLAYRLSHAGPERSHFTVRPFVSFRSIHGLRRGGDGLAVTSRRSLSGVELSDGSAQSLSIVTTAPWSDDGNWYYNFLYAEERARGYDATEDLFSPGFLTLAALPQNTIFFSASPSVIVPQNAFDREKERRTAITNPLDRAAEKFVVRRGKGHSIIAGYPWFGDWGRDTFIALRGLLLARGDLSLAGDVISTWLEHLSQGMIPNRFLEENGKPEYNSVDASLWFVVAASEYLELAEKMQRTEPSTHQLLSTAIRTILSCYFEGTRYSIKSHEDGLLWCGDPGTQLTWMDARVDGIPITPRWGKPVEIQALWIKALRAGARIDRLLSYQWTQLADRASRSFLDVFWNPATSCLYDVVTDESKDPAIRPNQTLGIPALPLKQAAAALDTITDHLFTPVGLRSLSPSDGAYKGHYRGDQKTRDASYHQGTVWLWLMGPYVEAWIAVRDSSALAKSEAKERFVTPLISTLTSYGIIGSSELAEGESPNAFCGTPFQAWSLGELIRMAKMV